MITEQEFGQVLQALSRTLPRFKPWDEMAMALAWATFPARAKELLTRDMWLYAAGQRRLDPAPPEDVPLDLQLLNYVFRNENGRANIEWGLKADLPERMAHPDRFNPQPVPGQLVTHVDEPVTNPLLQGVRW